MASPTYKLLSFFFIGTLAGSHLLIYIGNHMVTNAHHLDLTFGALSDATRRSILMKLANGPASVGTLAEPFEMSRPAISKHLRVLERAGLVRRTRDGRISRCQLDARPMKGAADWVEWYRKYWEQQLDQLASYFDKQNTPDTTHSGRESN